MARARRARALLRLAVLLGVGPVLVAPAEEEPALLVTVGEASAGSTVLWVRAPDAGVVAADVLPVDGQGRVERRVEVTEETDFTASLPLAGLRPATRHEYRVRWRTTEVRGTFTTAPPDEAVTPFTLVWSGDLGSAGRCRAPGTGYPIFHAMRERRPHLFLFLGDTMYADRRCPVPPNAPGADFVAGDLAGFRAKHRYHRADPAVQGFFRTTAVSAIWDDHEVRNDFSGTTESLMPAGRRAFLEYWPIRPTPEDPTRLYRRVRWGRLVELFVLDTRQYRSSNAVADGPSKTMLGGSQRDWLLAGLRESSAVWKLVASSVSLSVPTGRPGSRDGWASGPSRGGFAGPPTGFEHELLTIVEALARDRVRNVIWLVADVHHPEVIRHDPRPGVTFHELVAGPLSASWGRPGPLDETLHPTRLFGDGGYDSFGELSVTGGGLTARILDAAGQTRFETSLTPAP